MIGIVFAYVNRWISSGSNCGAWLQNRPVVVLNEFGAVPCVLWSDPVLMSDWYGRNLIIQFDCFVGGMV